MDFNVQRKLNTNVNVEVVGGRVGGGGGRESRRESESRQIEIETRSFKINSTL